MAPTGVTPEDDVPNPDKVGQTKIQRKHMQIRGYQMLQT